MTPAERDAEDIDDIADILDALATKLSRDRPKDETLALLAARARNMHRQRAERAR
jgi:hypothetical protein